MNARRAGLLDTVLYGVSALFALGVSLSASIPLYREWGRIAIAPYTLGAALACGIALARAGIRARAWLAAAVFIGAALVPLAAETTWRSHSSPGLHVQSEAIVSEEGAKALVHGRDPYGARFVHGPLAARPLATKTHFPYLPGMLVFGMPRTADGRSPMSDARVWFAVATLVVTWLALRSWRSPPDSMLRVVQVLLVLPTGALLMATGGDDLPVLALLLLSFVLFEERRSTSAGLTGGLAGALKQSAWLTLPFILIAAYLRDGREGAFRLAGSWCAISLPLVVIFAVWNPSAFLEDTVRFPLGLGHGATAAQTPTLGSALVHALPHARVALTLGLAAAAVAVAVLVLVTRPPASASAAAGECGLVLAVALLLAPAARLGYVVYPVNLLVWSWLFNSSERSSSTATRNTSRGSGSEARTSSRR